MAPERYSSMTITESPVPLAFTIMISERQQNIFQSQYSKLELVKIRLVGNVQNSLESNTKASIIHIQFSPVFSKFSLNYFDVKKRVR